MNLHNFSLQVTQTPINTGIYSASPVAVSSVTSTVAPTPTNTPTYTLEKTPFPTPIIGAVVTNSPTLFNVESWNDNSERCNSLVVIYGVIISHGTSPYSFTFWSQREPFMPQNPIIRQVTALKNSRDYVEFIPPIVVTRGKYQHVELTFQREDGREVTWIDDLYYSYNEKCTP